MKTIARTFLLVMVTVLSYGGRALAHHSFAAEFDAQKPVTLKGTVVKWEMINPHGWITIDVTGPDGKTAQWMIETSNPNGLMRLGWSKRSLKPGDEITVEAYGPRTGRTRPTRRGSLLPTAARCLRVLQALRRERPAPPQER